MPVVLTLHDAWLLSGHCAHSFDCERWRTGCGQCSDLSIYPAIRRDATAHNWRRKQDVYRRSRVYVATPSRWLMDKVRQSMLGTAIVEARVIPNGTDLSLFRPASQRDARAQLGLPQEVDLLLFTANGIRRNIWKDYTTLREALARVAGTEGEKPILFVGLGEDASSELMGRVEIRFIPYQEDTKLVASFYQAADIYLHAAKADTFPNTVLEALACGTPVVATAVGGIPEQIKGLGWERHTKEYPVYPISEATGILVPPKDPECLAKAIWLLLKDEKLREHLGGNAAKDARARFDLDKQVDAYLEWFEEILLRRSSYPKE